MALPLSPKYMQGAELFEGKHARPYRDCSGLWTIGIGHLIRASEVNKYLGGMDFQKATTLFKADPNEFYKRVANLTEEQIHALKCSDMAGAIKEVQNRLLRWGVKNVPQRCFEVLVDLAFNGGPGFLDGSIATHMKANDFDAAVLFSPRFCLAGDPHNSKIPVPFAGLTFRRYTFVWYYFTGEIWRIGAEKSRDEDWKEAQCFLDKLTTMLKGKGLHNPLPYLNNRRENQKY